MLIPTADAAGTVHLVGTAPAGIYYMLQEHEIGECCRQLSDNRPENLIRGPSTIAAHWVSTPSKSYADELLDWDAFIKVAPARPSGTLLVRLEYGGRGTPTPLRDLWD